MHNIKEQTTLKNKGEKTNAWIEFNAHQRPCDKLGVSFLVALPVVAKQPKMESKLHCYPPLACKCPCGKKPWAELFEFQQDWISLENLSQTILSMASSFQSSLDRCLRVTPMSCARARAQNRLYRILLQQTTCLDMHILKKYAIFAQTCKLYSVQRNYLRVQI